jgi:hypothetical protein
VRAVDFAGQGIEQIAAEIAEIKNFPTALVTTSG